jgi:hypothetical protein
MQVLEQYDLVTLDGNTWKIAERDSPPDLELYFCNNRLI